MSEKKEKESSKTSATEKTLEKKKATITKEEKVVKTEKEVSEIKVEDVPAKKVVKKTTKKKVPPVSEKETESKVKIKEIPEIKDEEVSESSDQQKDSSESTPKVSTKEDLPPETPDSVEEPKKTSIKETDYTLLSEEMLITELRTLISEKPIQEIKEEVEKIKTEFNVKFNEELEKNKEAFLAEGKSIIDFYYTTPLKKEFDSVYYEFKDKRNNYYKSLTKDLKVNLKNRLELIEELKGLFDEKGNTSTIFKHFKNIQERWYDAGAIPRDKYNTVWNNYHHHVENFYDILHLDREFRDRNFKYNLEQKLILLGRAEELKLEEYSNKAFRELQMLHKIWKEETGPVAKEFREDVWDKFSEATKIIHDKRHEHIEKLEKKYEANVDLKMSIIEKINLLIENIKPSHKEWQNAIKKVQEFRDEFFDSGRVPKSRNKEIWNLFKEATRNFNKEKNNYYKGQKKDQFKNLELKQELLKIANENKDNDDFEVVTPLMKKIQNDWKNIGHVPRKDSDKIWKEFKGVCNYYFDRLHSKENEANEEELKHFESKKELIKTLETLEFKGDPKEDIKIIKEKISEWKKIGRVPFNKKNIEFKFNKKLDALFNKLDLSKKETELIKFENKLSTLVSQDDERKLRNEEFFISKRVDESKDEVRQLENNLLFFKHVADDNPLVKEVNNKINKQKEQLEVWKSKLKKIRKIRKG